MIRTQVYIPEDQYNELKLLTAMGYGTFSELFREGINEVIKKKKVKKTKKFDVWKDFVGKGKKGGPTDISANLDYYLYVGPMKTRRKENEIIG